MPTDYSQLEELLKEQGADAVLDQLISEFREQKRYGELFEVMKMKLRRRIGLPLLYSDAGDELEEQQRLQLEEGLLESCREIGEALLRDGRVREGWMYLRPVGDRDAAASLIAAIEPDDDNLDELVEVCLHEAVDVGRGYGLVLEHYGTCNAITTFESGVYAMPKEQQQQAARLLVAHVHDELITSLRSDIAQKEGEEPKETTIAELVADRDWMFGEYSYHIDTTHLASTVRYARVCDDPESLRLALDLTEYGRRLNSQFQYEGDEPFVEQYPSHALYFQALLGENVDAALKYFLDKAKQVDAVEWSTIAIDVYVDLLARMGRHQEAINAALELTPANARPANAAPSLLELAITSGKFDEFLAHSREQQDLLGFATGLLLSKSEDQ